jgi:antitoxin MazE
MTRATVGKWGKSLAIRIPGDLAAATGIADGSQVDVEAQAEGIVIRLAVPRLTLENLFKGQTAEQWRRAYADAFDWGPDVGREIIEA